MIEHAKESNDVAALYQEHHDLIESSFPGLELDQTDQNLAHQNRNPVKKLTSGPEERVEKPIVAGGKARYEKREYWWNDYGGRSVCLGIIRSPMVILGLERHPSVWIAEWEIAGKNGVQAKRTDSS